MFIVLLSRKAIENVHLILARTKEAVILADKNNKFERLLDNGGINRIGTDCGHCRVELPNVLLLRSKYVTPYST